jgi:hypothetical protein
MKSRGTAVGMEGMKLSGVRTVSLTPDGDLGGQNHRRHVRAADRADVAQGERGAGDVRLQIALEGLSLCR